MLKVNTEAIEELTWSSPKGTFAGAGRQVSEALGRDPKSTDVMQRHPFDVEILRVPPGKAPYPYHAHGAQWEFYHILSGEGSVRHQAGTTPVVSGDAFVFKPGEAHQLTNTGKQDLIVYVIADNPLHESNYFPDSNKWTVPMPKRTVIRSEPLDYFDGEE